MSRFSDGAALAMVMLLLVSATMRVSWQVLAADGTAAIVFALLAIAFAIQGKK